MSQGLRKKEQHPVHKDPAMSSEHRRVQAFLFLETGAGIRSGRELEAPFRDWFAHG